jgi:hypothetical protein
MGGPPIVLFWLGGQSGGPVVRANVIVFFALTTLFTVATLASRQLFAADALALSLLLLPAYAAGLAAGAGLFVHSRAAVFRRVVLSLIAAIALASLAL